MRRTVLLLAASTTVAVGACATLPACPAKGGPTWRELTSRNVTLRTDLDEPDARETIRRLEEIRAAMLALFWPTARAPTVRTNAVVLRSIGELARFTRDPRSPPEVWGFRTTEPPFEPWLALGGTDAKAQRVLTHELVHDVITWYMPIHPPWYDEGMATFLETIAYDRATGLLEAGRPPPGTGRASASRRVSATALLDDGFSESSPNLAEFEARAWLLVHFLVDSRPRDLDRLSAALEATGSTAEAWTRVLPDLPIDRLDAALDDYAGLDTARIIERALTVPAPEVKVRVMTDAEVHVDRAQLLWSRSVPGVDPDREGTLPASWKRLPSPRSEATPGAFASRRLVWFTPQAERPRLAAAAEVIAGTHPDDWLAWWTVGVTAKSISATRTAFVRALAIDSNQPAVLSSLAAIDLNEHRYEEALAFATKGMSFRQDVWGFAFKAFDAQLALGHCADAALLAQVLKTRGPQNLRALVERVAPASVSCKPIPIAPTANPAPPTLTSP